MEVLIRPHFKDGESLLSIQAEDGIFRTALIPKKFSVPIRQTNCQIKEDQV